MTNRGRSREEQLMEADPLPEGAASRDKTYLRIPCALPTADRRLPHKQLTGGRRPDAHADGVGVGDAGADADGA